MTKSKTSILALAVVAGVTLSSVASQAATVAFSAGDLILGFRDSADTVDFQYDIGSASTLRSNGGVANSGASIGNIGSYLSANFSDGGNWYQSSTLKFGAVADYSTTANIPTPGDAVNGDPSRTLYFTRSRATAGTQSSTPGSISGTNRGNAANSIWTLGNTMGSLTATTGDNKGVVLSSTAAGANWSDYTASGSQFSALGTIDQAFNIVGNTTYAGISNVVGMLDLYRVLDTTTALNTVNPNSLAAGASQYVSTIVLTQSGDVYAVPEPSTYALFGLAGLGIAAIVRRKKLNA